MHRSLWTETKNIVISKAQAADWVYNALPEWRRQIELARKAYACRMTPKDKEFILAEVKKFLEFAKRRIKQRQAKSR